jgi:diaminopimelate epimerase
LKKKWAVLLPKPCRDSAPAAAAIAVKGLASRLHVHAPGGGQIVEWNGPQINGSGELYLSGRVRLVCCGEFSFNIFV